MITMVEISTMIITLAANATLGDCLGYSCYVTTRATPESAGIVVSKNHYRHFMYGLN